MKTFEEYMILEEILKIGNAEDYRKSGVDKRDDLTKDIHDKDINDTKDSLESYRVGVVNGITIFKSIHAHEIRDGEGLPRDYGLTDEDVLKIFEKLFLKPAYNPKNKTMVAYKNHKGKFDLMVISPLEYKYIKIITIIQGNKNRSYDYFTQSHLKDQKAIIESSDLNGVQDFLIIE
jgi:hypothetical protein